MLSLVIAAGFLYFASSFRNSKTRPAPQGKTAFDTVAGTRGIDSDADGLEDWEELLRNTDPNNPDSDGDGILDGDESVSSQSTNDLVNPTIIDSLSPTRVILQDFAQYVQAHVVPGEEYEIDFDERLNKALITGGIEEIKKVDSLYNPYKIEHVVLNNNRSEKEYINDVAIVTEKSFPDNLTDEKYESEFTVLYKLAFLITEKGEGVTEQDLVDNIEKLEKYQLRYLDAVRDLSGVETPVETAHIHVALLNSLANTSLALRSIMAYGRDPILGTSGMNHYQSEIENSKKIFTEIKKLIDDKKIVFGTKEPGYQFQQDYVNKI
ncbi:MAG: hypothetical protein O2794_02790 [bacterium]|nr:hypothetical protein [bacterium]